MKLTKPIFGAANGEIYPRVYAVGEDCPPELEAAAQEAGALASVKAMKKAPETK